MTAGTDFAGKAWSRKFDAVGQMTEEVERNGVTTRQAFDTVGNNGGTSELSYDG